MEAWDEIKDEVDIENFLHLYGHFHDSCLRDAYIQTRESVAADLTMTFDGNWTAVLLFQRQYRNPTVIEMKFDNLSQFNFKAADPDYNSLIFDVTFNKTEGIFYWASEGGWTLGDNSITWISSSRVFWRERPALIGPVARIST
ncbi:hypothetical protein [uncultured Imperialibacter sp.]|uniref:hypothetical protein n=1 Tax=uncultured Imperialibacter sp. TaxID=1672639 RepID=UPI0030DCE8B0|tara:strand:+ start:1809 stop:2237 length:429 start_codon:yes stop_codon:yes gene_type:complete